MSSFVSLFTVESLTNGVDPAQGRVLRLLPQDDLVSVPFRMSWTRVGVVGYFGGKNLLHVHIMEWRACLLAIARLASILIIAISVQNGDT